MYRPLGIFEYQELMFLLKEMKDTLRYFEKYNCCGKRFTRMRSLDMHILFIHYGYTSNKAD